MSGNKTAKITKWSRNVAWLWIIAASLTTLLSSAARADFAETLTPQGVQPMPPPLGDGPQSRPEISGDTGAVEKPPSGQADTASGNSFPAGNGQNRTVVHVYRTSTDRSTAIPRGTREVQTIRPDQLTADQINQINSILGIDIMSGKQDITVKATDVQIEQIQNVLAPYPGFTQSGDGRKKIEKNIRGIGYPKRGDENSYVFDGVLPTVRYLARYLVILGVVSATVMMAMAATSVVFGHPYGPSRVIGVIGGLILLLMSYTIWKIVQMNTYKANSIISGFRTDRQEANTGDITPSDTPVFPTAGRTSPARSGVPLQPLGDTGNP